MPFLLRRLVTSISVAPNASIDLWHESCPHLGFRVSFLKCGKNAQEVGLGQLAETKSDEHIGMRSIINPRSMGIVNIKHHNLTTIKWFY